MAARVDAFSALGRFASKADFKKVALEERCPFVISRLAKFSASSRPRKVKTLLSSMNSIFGKQLEESELKAVFVDLVAKGVISVGASDSLSYSLPEGQRQ